MSKKTNDARNKFSSELLVSEIENFTDELSSIIDDKNNPDTVFSQIIQNQQVNAQAQKQTETQDLTKLFNLIKKVHSDNIILRTEMSNLKVEINKLKKNQLQNVPVNSNDIEQNLDLKNEISEQLDLHLNLKMVSVIDTFEKKINEIDTKISNFKKMYLHRK